MKKFLNFILFITYITIALVQPFLTQTIRNIVAKTFNLTLPVLVYTVFYIVCTLLLLLRTHLAERTFTPQNVLIQGAYVAVTIALLVYCFFHQMSSLLPALLTETVFDLVLLFIRRNHSPSE